MKWNDDAVFDVFFYRRLSLSIKDELASRICLKVWRVWLNWPPGSTGVSRRDWQSGPVRVAFAGGPQLFQPVQPKTSAISPNATPPSDPPPPPAFPDTSEPMQLGHTKLSPSEMQHRMQVTFVFIVGKMGIFWETVRQKAGLTCSCEGSGKSRP